MGLEVAPFIDGLVLANPVGNTDTLDKGDDHIRLIKSAVKASFPNVNAAVSPTPTEFNLLVGMTAAQLAAGGKHQPIPVGTVMLFFQAAAPTGWTKLATQNDKALRIVSGTGGGVAGNNSFTGALGTSVIAGAHVLSLAQTPSHNHGAAGAHGHNFDFLDTGGSPGTTFLSVDGATLRTRVTGNKTATSSVVSSGAHTHTTEGGNATHTHSFNIQYIDLIQCSKG